MKNFKRILALVLVLCTVAAWMIPGVSAAAPASKTFDIKADTVAAGVTYGSGNRFWSDVNCRTNLENYYATSGWAVYTNDAGAIVNTGYPPRFYTNGLQFYPNALSTYAYSVMKIVAPGTGDYILSLKPSVISSADERAEIAGAYIIPYGNYDKSTLPGVDSEAAAAGSKVTLNDTNLREQVFHAGEGTVSLVEGQEYLLVFYYYDTTLKTAKADFQAFSLTAVAKYDYTVTYHANYEGAPVATFADSENATGIADATKDITVDTITREGLFKLAGWATTADGEVVYKAGDVISMTGDTTLDLYAIWEEAWDPANNTDLTVDFATAFENAGIASGQYLQVAANYNALNAAYATNKWTVYMSGDDYIRPNALYAGGRNRVGYLEVRNNNIASYGATATLISRFIAPGEGEYKLSVSYGTAANGDYKATEIGAYILEVPETAYTKYNIPGPTSASILTKASKTEPYSNGSVAGSGSGAGTFSAENTVMLEGGKEYIIVFYSVAPDTTNAYANFESFALTEVKPAASIGSTNYATVEEAVAAAVSGNTIKLGMDADVAELNPAAGVVVDLNGKTLTVSGAVAATVADSGNGTGLLAAAKTSVVSAANGQVALWDNTADAEGYRVFNYNFSNYGEKIYEGTNKAVTAVDTEIDFYDYERNFLATSFDENGEVAKGAGDYRFNDVAAQIKADYDNGDTDWRLEYSNQQYQMGRGGVCFSWGNKSIRQFGAGYMAVRFASPAAGKVAVTLKTSSAGSEANDASFDLYLLKASDVEALYEGDYEALVDTFVAAPATAVADLNTTIQTAYGAAEPVLSGMSDGNAYTGEFEFAEGQEYIAVFLNTGNGGLHMNFQNISFYRAAKEESMAQSIWSVLEFTNSNAYALIASGENALSVGFDMAWNGVGKTFAFTDDQVLAWAEQELADDETYGFYIRIEGFEKVGSGTLTGTPYISFGGNKITADTVTYNYTAE